MKRKLVKGLATFALGFVALFCLRLIYGYGTLPVDVGFTTRGFIDNNNDGNARQGQSEWTRKNYASNRQKVGGQAHAVAVDQKYEKVATLSSTTPHFERDEKTLRGTVQTHGALIQVEQSAGLSGARFLQLSIGVPPDKFDAMIEDVKKIGHTSAIQVTKKDKTNEYKDLNAQRISLEKARDSLVGLKGRGGQIEELVNLEKKILELEESVQKLGVRLGEYDAENEFVTIQFTLQEKRAAAPTSSFQRAMDAFEWTIKYYVVMLVLFFFATLSTLFVISIAQRLNWIPNALRTLSDPAPDSR